MVMLVLVGFRRLKQKDHEFKVSLAYIGRHCLTKEMTQLVKCFLFKREDLSLSPRTQVKKARHHRGCLYLSTGEAETGATSGLACKLVYSGSERELAEYRRWGLNEEGTQP